MSLSDTDGLGSVIEIENVTRRIILVMVNKNLNMERRGYKNTNEGLLHALVQFAGNV